MPDLSDTFQRAAADLGPVRQPGFSTLLETRRRRDRSRAAGAALGVALLVTTLAVALPRLGDDRAVRPADPTPGVAGYACLLPSGQVLGVGQQREEDGRTVRCENVSWTTAAPAYDGSAVLDVTVPQHGCGGDLSVAVRESDEAVEIAVLQVNTVEPAVSCPVAPPFVRFAQLQAPLGTRTVTHASLAPTDEGPAAEGPAYAVVGQLLFAGGPVPTAPPAGIGPRGIPGRVYYDDGHGLAGTIGAGPDGAFSLLLPEGTYQVVGSSPSIGSSTAAFGQQTVVVTPAGVDGLEVKILVP